MKEFGSSSSLHSLESFIAIFREKNNDNAKRREINKKSISGTTNQIPLPFVPRILSVHSMSDSFFSIFVFVQSSLCFLASSPLMHLQTLISFIRRRRVL